MGRLIFVSSTEEDYRGFQLNRVLLITRSRLGMFTVVMAKACVKMGLQNSVPGSGELRDHWATNDFWSLVLSLARDIKPITSSRNQNFMDLYEEWLIKSRLLG